MTITDLLTGAAHSGLVGLTLYSTQDGRWQASTTQDRQSWSVSIDADPVAALTRALAAFAVSAMTTDNSSTEDIFS